MRKFLRFLLWTAIIIGAIIGLLRLSVLRWWRVPLPEDDPYLEASISPTLRGGDWIILWRLGDPAFGDLVICPEPKAEGRIVIGRIAGEGGDTIKIEDGSVWINNRRAPTERSCDGKEFTSYDPQTKREVSQSCHLEVLGPHTHKRGNVQGQSVAPGAYQTVVPKEHFFLLSDNRLFPYDSREFGPVEQSSCKEMIVFRLVSRKGFFDVENRFTFIQ